MNKDLVFAIDVDEVIRSLVPQMLNVYNRDFNENLKPEDVIVYNCEEFFPRIQKERGVSAGYYFFEEHAIEMFVCSDVIKGAKEAMDILREYGTVVVVTYQKTLDNIKYTLDWLDKYDIKYDSICFTPDKSFIKSNYMVDDNCDFFKNCKTDEAIVINRPYNKDVDMDSIAKSSKWFRHYRRFNSLIEFAYYIKALCENNISENDND